MVLNILLVWFHPPAMSTVWVAVAAILNLFIWIVTVTLAIPSHKQLDHNKSVELIDKLIFYHVFESSPRPHSYARHGFVVPGGESVESRIGAVKADFIIARSYPSVGIRAALLAGYHGIVAGWLSLSCRIVLAFRGHTQPLTPVHIWAIRSRQTLEGIQILGNCIERAQHMYFGRPRGGSTDTEAEVGGCGTQRGGNLCGTCKVSEYRTRVLLSFKYEGSGLL